MIKVTVQGLCSYEPELFAGLVANLPESCDKEAVINTIVERYGELGAIYIDPTAMQNAITVWANASREIFARLWATVTAEYNFLDNYDRTTSISRSTTAQSEGTGIDSKTAFDSAQFRATGKSESSGENTSSESVTEHTHGNIGVTSSMQLVSQERAIAAYNFADNVAKLFAEKFTVGVW